MHSLARSRSRVLQAPAFWAQARLDSSDDARRPEAWGASPAARSDPVAMHGQFGFAWLRIHAEDLHSLVCSAHERRMNVSP
jgi:hypothetical protein